jgi:hypothetical protein
MWVLALALKALLKSIDAFHLQTLPGLLQSDFVRCIVLLATHGTSFNRKWIVEDLEVKCWRLFCNK